MMYQKVVDALMGVHPKKARLEAPPDIDPGHYQSVLAAMRDAQVFEFPDFPLEPAPPMPDGHLMFQMPKITDEEWGFWHQGLLPLPFDNVWYEWQLGRERCGILVMADATKWHIIRFDDTDGFIYTDWTVLTADQGEAHTGHTMTVQLACMSKMMTRGFLERPDDPNLQMLKGATRDMIGVAVYMTLMLNSSTTERSRANAPKFANFQRREKKLPLLKDHTVVRIVPVRYLRESDGDTVGDRRGPRLHWRRSHLRHYQTGKVQVIPRCLVGRADLGEVSHTYKVSHG